MSSVLIVIVILLGLIIALLAVPIDLAFSIDRTNKVQGYIKVRWLFGLTRFTINIPDETKTKILKAKRKALPEYKTEKPKEKSAPGNLIAVLKQSAFRQRVYRFIKDLLRAIHSHDLQLHLRVGLGDPADTGRLWIFLGPVSALLTNIHSANICIEPEFMDPVFEFQSNGEFRLMPLEFIVLTIAFIFSPPTIHAWRTLKQNNV